MDFHLIQRICHFDFIDIGKGTASYTGSSRFDLNNFVLQTHRVELKGTDFFVRGYRVEEIENPLTQKARYLDKVVDELAKGRKMEKILRVA